MGDQENLKSSLVFHDYIVNHIEFTTNENFQEGEIDIKFRINRNIEYGENSDNTVYVSLDVVVFDKASENNYPFTLKLKVTGKFEIFSTDEEKRHTLVTKNTIAILFPYVRSLISTYTANANVPPLILPPINVLRFMDD